MINIGTMLSNRAYLSPNLEAFVGENYRYTFDQANARVNQLASYLLEQNIKHGKRLAILCKNNQYFATALFAAAKAGAVAVPLNWRLQARELAYIINDCGASLILYDSEFSPVVDKLRSHIPACLFIRAGGAGPDPEFEDILAGKSAEEPKEVMSGDDDTAVIMYTSGTTGKPKGAMLAHSNFFAASIGLSHTIDWRYRDRFLAVAPFFHIGGLAPLVTNIHKGCTIVFMPNFDPLSAWEVIVKEKINNLMSVPLMLQAMLRVPGVEKLDLGALRTIICGGSPVPDSLIKAYLQMGIKVEQVYGITEYSGAVTFWTHDMPPGKSVSMGKPVFHGDIKIINPENGKELPPGDIGEILCGGPQVFKGYWNNREATGNAIVDGWYHSGDLGKKDEDGFVYVIDRLKDMIISGGENIYSAELEAVINTHPAVAEAAVVGVPDSKWGEIPRAYVVKKPGLEVSEEDIVGICKQNLASYKCVKEVKFIDALPRNAVGKILKNVLKQQSN
ncbi:long-chain-fatty-acid--CoA ligase [Desulfotruncus alcoholivorax]|uniref:long-chain-fatty-acid--CoA ligase n=1 Tax=Desulfotruncus alcoholivorax TaxID=265477 RepID=UPI00041524C0|nr:long-chain-fatty-acid--CoA ligase [Desulfotruncus alcoholivorax]